MSKYQRRIFQILTIVTLVGLICHGRQIQIKPDIEKIRHNYNYQTSVQYISQKNKTNIFKFPQINFEISGQFYGLLDSVSVDQMYNKAAYTDDLSQYCYLYWTSTSIRTSSTVKFQQDFQIIKYYLYDRTQDSLLYILGDNSILYRYKVTQNQITNEANFTVPESISQLMNRQSKSNVEIIVIKQKLFLFNNQSMHVLHQNDGSGTFVQVDGYVRMGRLVDTGVVYKNMHNNATNSISGFQIWVCEERGIKIYDIIDENYKIFVKPVHEKTNITNDTILAVYYQQKLSTFFFTTSNNLFKHKIPSPSQSGAPIQPQTHWYKINGTCRSINKIKQALYLSCQYQRVSYIAQFQVKQDDVIINRFYDQFFVDGIRDVESLGFDRIALIGDEEAVIIGQAVNRNILIQLNNKGDSQLKQNIFSFGMIDLFYLPQFSTPSKTVALSVGFDALQIVRVLLQPPQLQCVFPPEMQSSVISLVGVFNTTHCPYSLGDPNSLGGTYLVCQSFFPIKLDLKTKQYEEKTANFIFFVLMLLAVVMVLLFAGCGVKIRNKANAIIQSARRQINKIQRQRQSSQLKKI